jgi:hypothetical protein
VWSGGGLAEECSNPSVTWKAGDTSFLFFSFSFLFFLRAGGSSFLPLNKHRPKSDEKIQMLLVIHILVPQIKQAGERSYLYIDPRILNLVKGKPR